MDSYGGIPVGFATFKALVADAIEAAFDDAVINAMVTAPRPMLPPEEPLTVYISIGNSDDKLPQADWSRFTSAVRWILDTFQKHGAWYSPTTSPWQSACWCVVVPQDRAEELKLALGRVAAKWRQESIAWAVADVTLLPALPIGGE